MKNFCIITNPYKDKEYALTNKMKSYIELKGGSCQVITEKNEIPSSVEVIFVLGGDGTLIRAAGVASEKDIPMSPAVVNSILVKTGYPAISAVISISIMNRMMSRPMMSR